MASSDFANRFKDKIEKIGKSGLTSLNANFPITKTEVPESKIHKSILTLIQSKPRLIMSNKGIEEINCSSKQTSRSKSSLKLLPPLRASPSKLVLNQFNRSAIESQEAQSAISGRSQNNRSSCMSLPKISQRLINVKSILAKSRKMIESIKESA